MTPPTIPGDLTNERAGSILARGLFVIPPVGFCDPDIVTHHPNGMRCMTVFRGIVEIAAMHLDPSRPEVRDHCARWLGRAHGLEIGATAPEWRRFRLGLPDGSESWAWALLGTPGEQFFFTDGNVPGISVLTDPAEALSLACLHAGGRS